MGFRVRGLRALALQAWRLERLGIVIAGTGVGMYTVYTALHIQSKVRVQRACNRIP